MSHAPESQPPESSSSDSTVSGLGNASSTLGSTISRSAIIGAIFLMATSAIGPGFITQTATFTAQMGAAFAFAIFVSILIDIAIQLNIWRMVTSSGKRAAQLASSAVPGSGIVLSILIVIGGLAFNIGNIAGGGLGLNALLGIGPKLGGLITGLLAIGIFLFKRAGKVVDTVVLVLGIGMIILTCVVAAVSDPPVGEAIRQSFLPDTISFATITTIVGGTVGGYITYSGAHRYLDSGRTGPDNAGSVMRSALSGIIVTGIMRYILFVAILGVVASGVAIDLDSQVANPAGQAFAKGIGSAREERLRLFGPWKTGDGYVFLAGIAAQNVTGQGRIFSDFMVTREATADALNSRTPFRKKGYVDLLSKVDTARETTADHDGCAVLLVARE